MTTPTGDALKASAAQDIEKVWPLMLNKLRNDPKTSEAIPGWLSDRIWDAVNYALRNAALSPVEQAPQPVAQETHLRWASFEEVDWKFVNALCKALVPKLGYVPFDDFMVDSKQRWLTAMKAALVEVAPAPHNETHVRVNPDQERMIRDIVGSAYDRGYTDARNASATPGDNAPGYRGQDAERAHSDELLARFNRLAAIVENPTPTEAPPVESQAAEIGDLRDQRASLIARGIDPNLDHIPDHGVTGRWLPIECADKTITDVQEFSEVGMTIKTSDRYWVRDGDGRVYEAAWSEGKYGRDFWWDFEGESPVDPVEFMPHPLDARWPALAAEGSAE